MQNPDEGERSATPTDHFTPAKGLMTLTELNCNDEINGRDITECVKS